MRMVTRHPYPSGLWSRPHLAGVALGGGLALAATALTAQADASRVPTTQLEAPRIVANPPATAAPASAESAAVPALGVDRTPIVEPLVPVTGTDATEDIRDRLSAAIVALENDIETLAQLRRWQTDLTRIAKTDRTEALRQRRPMRECEGTVLDSLCDELTGLFQDPKVVPDGTLQRGD